MRHIKCVVVGDGNSGKRDFIRYLTVGLDNHSTEESIPKAFDEYSTNMFLPNVPVNLQILDTSGQEEYKKLRPISYPQTNVFVYVFKISSPTSFENIETMWIPEVEEICPNTPAILVATSCELVDEKEKAHEENWRIIEDLEVGRLLKRHPNIKDYFKCSVSKSIGVTEAFTSAAIVSLNGEIEYKYNFPGAKELSTRGKISTKQTEEMKNVRKFAIAIGDVEKVVRPSQIDYKLMIMINFADIVDVFDIGRRASILIIAFTDREKLQYALDNIDSTVRNQEDFESVVLLHIYQSDVFDSVTDLDMKRARRIMGKSFCNVSYIKIKDGYKWEELRDLVLGDKSEFGSNSTKTNAEGCSIA